MQSPRTKFVRSVSAGTRYDTDSRPKKHWVKDRVREILSRQNSVNSAEDSPRPYRDLRLLPTSAASVGAAVLATHTDPDQGAIVALLSAAAAIVLLMLCLTFKRNSLAVLLVVPLAVAAAVVFSAAIQLDSRVAGQITADIAGGSDVLVQLAAASDANELTSQWGSPRYRVEADVREVVGEGRRYGSNARLLVVGGEAWAGVQMGDRIRAAGKLASPPSGSDLTATLYASTAPSVQPAEDDWLSATAHMRASFREATSDHDPDVQGLLPGMVLGDRSMLTDKLETAMKGTGLTHLTAVSGSNCAFILAFAFLCARLCRLQRGPAVLVAVVALAGFVLLVRPDPSVLRAAVMGALGVVAILSGRGKLSLGLLQLAVIILIIADPWIHAEYGFILSVLATVGLILVGPPLVTVLSTILPRVLAVILSIPIAAQLLCTPVILTLQPDLPTYSVPANIAVSPAVPFITIVGMVAVVCGSIHSALAAAPLYLAAIGAKWVVVSAYFFSGLPAASTPWMEGPPGIILATLCTMLLIGGVGILSKRIKHPRSAGRMGLRTHKWKIAAICIGLTTWFVLLAAAAPVLPWQHQRQWNVAACDVAQGDGFAIRTGRASAIVVDAGPDPDLMDRCLTQLGVSAIDLLVLTHTHADHYGGIEGAVRGRRVGKVAHSASAGSLPATARSSIEDVPHVSLTSGDSGQQANVSWRVLWPADPMSGGNENNESCVLLISIEEQGHEMTILFTGDLEEEAAARVLAATPEIASGTVDVLKVAHHGARNGGSRIIEEVQPRVAMISVGAENSYGHPAPSIVAALESKGTTVLRTDTTGSFVLDLVGNQLIARSF